MVSIHAGDDSFVALGKGGNAFYSNATVCDPVGWSDDKLDHGVLLTGWKIGPDGKSYLEIENSWSELWGDNGFGYIDEAADCGIEGMVLLPNVKSA
jgi:hypothetical protein